jgi:hypothetical protein
MLQRGSNSFDILIIMYQDPYAPQNQQQHGQNPYTPPVNDAWNDPSRYAASVPRGSYWIGFAVGMVFTLFGLLVVYAFGEEETKRGALHGFGIRVALFLLFILVVVVMG